MHVYVCVRVCTCVHEHLLETHGDALAQAVELDRAVLVGALPALLTGPACT